MFLGVGWLVLFVQFMMRLGRTAACRLLVSEGQEQQQIVSVCGRLGVFANMQRIKCIGIEWPM